MDYRKFGEDYIVRLDPGDDVVPCLLALAEKEKIRLASIAGIGACDLVEVGVYEVSKRHYEMKHFEEEMEMLSLNGNLSEKDGKPYLHLHAVFGRADMEAVGGHLNKAVISGTGEIFVRCFAAALDRSVCSKTGLNIFDFEKEL